MALIKLVPARYIHFGMTHEMFDLFVNDIDRYAYLDWHRQLNTNAPAGSAMNCLCKGKVLCGDQVYMEDSRVENCTIGTGSILSSVDIHGETVPPNVVMHGLKLSSGKYVCRIYGPADNPKSSRDAPFLGGTVGKLIADTGISNDEIWGGQPASLWYARIYPVCDTMQAAIRSALDLYEILAGTASPKQIQDWKQADKTSLAESFGMANIVDILLRQDHIHYEVMVSQFVQGIKDGISQAECIAQICQAAIHRINFVETVLDTAKTESFPYNMRLYLAASKLCKDDVELKAQFDSEQIENDAYDCIKRCITSETFARFGIKPVDKIHFVQEETTVDLPVRVNFCGSPSDAAPYCLEHGGTMIDGTLLLKGKRPIRATVRRRPDKKIGFGSLDQHQNEVFEETRRCDFRS